jgi:transposase-like protein
MDTSFPFGYGKEIVVYTAIDDCSRYVYSRVYDNREQQTTKKFIDELVRTSPFPIL